MAGRHTKLTPAVHQQIVAFIRAGAYDEDEAFSMAKKVPNLATATPHRATAEGQPMPPGALLSRHQRRRRPPVPSAS